MVNFMLEFYKKFPSLKSHDFIVTGESYGGKYIPNIARSILDHNKLSPDKIPLSTVLIGDGLVDLVLQRTNVKALPIAAGYLTPDILHQYETIDQKCYGAIDVDPDCSQGLCDTATSVFRAYAPKLDIYDARYRNDNASYWEELFEEYLNDEEVRADIGYTINKEYAISNGKVSQSMRKDRYVPSIEVVASLLKEIPVLIYDAMFDMLDGPVGVQEWLYNLLEFEGIEEFKRTPRDVYYYVSDDNGEVRVGGYFKQVGNLVFCIVIHSGHLVPTTQLAMSRSLLEDMH